MQILKSKLLQKIHNRSYLGKPFQTVFQETCSKNFHSISYILQNSRALQFPMPSK